MTLYTIPPLAWTENEDGGERWIVVTVFGLLVVESLKEGGFRWRHPEKWLGGLCASIDDGKAKAEAYYRERLLPALEAVPPGEQP